MHAVRSHGDGIFCDRFNAMGTTVDIIVVTHDQTEARQALTLAREIVRRYEQALSFHASDSELTLLNNKCSSQAGKLRCGPLLGQALQIALHGKRVTSALFDPGYLTPDIEFELEYTENTWYLNVDRPGLRIDLGGVGKGIAADTLWSIFDNSIFSGVMMSMGGSSILALGDHPSGTGWEICGDRECAELSFTLHSACASFSSTKQRGSHPNTTSRTNTERLRHHSVGVVATSAASAEIASTALLRQALSSKHGSIESLDGILEFRVITHD